MSNHSYSFTAELRAKIDTHFHTTPLASQRKDFLAVTAATPLERKAHFTAEVVGAAAAYEAFKAFERHEIHKGSKPTHARGKEVSCLAYGSLVVSVLLTFVLCRSSLGWLLGSRRRWSMRNSFHSVSLLR